MSSTYRSLILDLGDVLFTWSARTGTTISSHSLRAVLSSDTWADYERGRISQGECYHRAAAQFNLDPIDIADALRHARDSLELNVEMFDLVRTLRAKSCGTLSVFALSNISIPDYEYLLTKPVDWAIFDRVFPSGLIGERKPDLQVYLHLIAATGIDPHTAVFVDDKLENVQAARSLGMHGIVFRDQAEVLQTLSNIFRTPGQRGREFLRRNSGQLESFTDTGLLCEENFAQLMILELTGDRYV